MAVGPVLDGYEALLAYPNSVTGLTFPEVDLAPGLLKAAEDLSNADPGNPYYAAHIDYFRRTLSILRAGGSAVLEGSVGQVLQSHARRFPTELFKELDKDWAAYVGEVEDGRLGLEVPPILAIILTRADRREDIPITVARLSRLRKKSRLHGW